MAEKMDRAQLVQQLQLRNLSGDGSLDELRARLDEALEEEAMMGGGDDFAAPTKRKSDSVAGGAAAAGEGAEDDSDDEFGPKPVAAPAKKRRVHKLKHEKLYLANLPKALMYEKSYMHRDVLTRVCVTPNTDFVVTASADGHLKFWKKLMAGVQFVKHFKAHLGPIVDLQSSHDGSRVCTLSSDKSLKIYEVLGFDMINMISLGFEPSCCVWLDRPGRPPKIAVGDSGSSVIRVYDAETASDTPPRIVKVRFFLFNVVCLSWWHISPGVENRQSACTAFFVTLRRRHRQSETYRHVAVTRYSCLSIAQPAAGPWLCCPPHGSQLRCRCRCLH